MYRTHKCNELRVSDVGKTVTLAGWVHRKRDHGGMVFVDLRDRYGYTQLVGEPRLLEGLKPEYVVRVVGDVVKRPDGLVKKEIETGEIEVHVKKVEVLNECEILPFEIDQDKEVGEEFRLKYRYLDLRRERMKNNIVMRHRVIKEIRNFMDSEGFLEIETPILIKGTPEGSREYLVPSRLYPGHFYVLPQSPQQLKQLLMVAGMDKYFQIARCFRDEDQRGDRQPEFTQLDIEMSFVEQEDILRLNEKLAIKLVEDLRPEKKIREKPFKRLTWKEAMDKYGSDKPDLRFGMEIVDISREVADSKFQVFLEVLVAGGFVRALKVDGGASYSRRELNEFEEVAKKYGAKGLANIALTSEGVKSSILKFLSDDEIKTVLEKCQIKEGDILFIVADEYEVVCGALGALRLEAGRRLGLMDDDEFVFCWIYDFPLFEFNKNDGSMASAHHPFTHPNLEDIPLLDINPEKVRAIAYDLVLNGSEIGGGSIRIHDSQLQNKIFKVLGISEENTEVRFGHMLKAFKYGAPPHGGIAWGLDRLIMIFQDELNIREVIAFPKDQKARDLMLDAPSVMPKEQVEEANVKIVNLKN